MTQTVSQGSLIYSFHTSVLIRAVELRPDMSCLWKLLGDACTAVSTVSSNRAQVVVPALLVGLDPNSQSHTLNQAQTLKVGERYDHKQGYTFSDMLPLPFLLCQIIHFIVSVQCNKKS